jgi:flagellar biosynthetic protein FliR
MGSIAFGAVNIEVFFLVFMRMSGAVLFNPLFGRSNVPVVFRGAISLLLALIVCPTLGGVTAHMSNVVDLVVQSMLELSVGFGLGVIVSILFSVVLLSGELIDAQMGFAMSSFYDPHNGVAMPILGSFFNALMVLTFFASNAHLTLLTFVSDSFSAVPPGTLLPTAKSFTFVVMLGRDYLELGLRMAIPVLAVEMVTIIAMGMLMRAVPQINVFSVSIQLQAIMGIAVVAIAVPVIVPLCDRLTTFILEKCAEYLRLLIR